MAKVTAKLNSQSGVSLVELLVVVVIISIVATLAVMSRGSANEQYQRQNGSRMLKAAFERARFDSVKRRADGTADRPLAHVVVRNNGFTLRTYSDDVNSNPVAKDESTNFSTGVVLAHYNSGLIPMTVTFNRRGETDGGVPQFYVCNVSCTSPTSATADLIIVTATGTVNLLGGSSTPPTFSNTALVGSTSNTASINEDVIIPTPTP